MHRSGNHIDHPTCSPFSVQRNRRTSARRKDHNVQFLRYKNADMQKYTEETTTLKERSDCEQAIIFDSD